MREVFIGFRGQWTKWAAIGLLTILASMAYVYLAREWSAFRVLLIVIIGLTLGLVESHIPGPSHVFNWVNASRLLGVALIIFLAASFLPNRTKAVTEWIAGNIDKTSATTSTKKTRIRIKKFAITDSWGESISVPEGWDFRVRDESGAPIEVKFWDGRVVSDAPETVGAPVNKEWEGVVKNCAFRIRRVSGEGVALVTFSHS